MGELASACTFRNQSSRIFISSSANLLDEEQISEFWSRDEEASGSEDDISDADGVDVAESMFESKSVTNSSLNDRIELLQRAEESYYRSNLPGKQVNKMDKNNISEALRESGKQRLLNTMKQNQQKLDVLRIDYEASAVTLENECYRKYGKSGKSFYLSQLASTVRWISTANSEALMNRLNSCQSPGCSATNAKSDCSLPSVSPSGGKSIVTDDEKLHDSSGSEAPVRALQHASEDKKLPPIPSFSDFINSRNPNDNKNLKSRKQPPSRDDKNPDKRMRNQ